MTDTRAGQSSGRNLLEELDSRIPTTFYWYLAVLACVGGFLFGYDTSNMRASAVLAASRASARLAAASAG